MRPCIYCSRPIIFKRVNGYNSVRNPDGSAHGNRFDCELYLQNTRHEEERVQTALTQADINAREGWD